MKKYLNKKNIRSAIIAIVVIATVGSIAFTTKIRPADSNQAEPKAKQEKQIAKKDEGKKEKKKEQKEEVKQDSDTENKASVEKNTMDEVEKGQISSESKKEQPAAEEKPGSTELPSKVEKPSTSNKPNSNNKPSVSEKPSVAEKPKPEQKKNITCSITITCDAISGNNVLTNNGNPQLEVYAANPVILGSISYTVQVGTTAYDLLKMACAGNGIPLDAEYTPAYSSYYVKGINNIYEFDAGRNSGWMYKVNGQLPDVGASSYQLSEGDVITWFYTI